MRPARFRQADFSLVKIDNAKSMSPAVSSGRSAGSFPEQRLVIEPRSNAPDQIQMYPDRDTIEQLLPAHRLCLFVFAI